MKCLTNFVLVLCECWMSVVRFLCEFLFFCEFLVFTWVMLYFCRHLQFVLTTLRVELKPLPKFCFQQNIQKTKTRKSWGRTPNNGSLVGQKILEILLETLCWQIWKKLLGPPPDQTLDLLVAVPWRNRTISSCHGNRCTQSSDVLLATHFSWFKTKLWLKNGFFTFYVYLLHCIE